MGVSKKEVERRQLNIRKLLEKMELDALIVEGSCAIDKRGWMRYFIDYYVPVFTEYLVIMKDGTTIFFARNLNNKSYIEEKCMVKKVFLIPPDDSIMPGKCICDYVKENEVRKMAYCGDLSAGFKETISCECENIQISNLTSYIEKMRSKKSEEELLLCREAVKLNEEVFKKFLSNVCCGNREIDAISAATGYALKKNCEDQFWLGGSGTVPKLKSIPSIIESNYTWKEEDLCSVVIEIAGPGGYYGEITHVISIGEPSENIRKAFKDLANARKYAEKYLKPGECVGKIAEAVNEKLAKEGYGNNSITGIIGHGQGLDMSEPPMIYAGNSETLEEGMRINLHPTLTIENGINITACDCYEITADGCKKLSDLENEIIVI